MGNLLFSPTGLIGSKTFLKAGVVLSLVSGLLFWILVVEQRLGKMGLVLFLSSFYPWFCLWSKRLRTGGKSAGMVFAYLMLFIVLCLVFYIVALLFFSGGDFTEAMMASARKEISMEEYSERLNRIGASLDPNIVLRNILMSFTLASLITLFVGDRATTNQDDGDH